jgi:hypothetical protein
MKAKKFICTISQVIPTSNFFNKFKEKKTNGIAKTLEKTGPKIFPSKKYLNPKIPTTTSSSSMRKIMHKSKKAS